MASKRLGQHASGYVFVKKHLITYLFSVTSLIYLILIWTYASLFVYSIVIHQG